MKETICLEYEGEDIQTSLTRADKFYSQAEFNKQAKFGLLRDYLKSDQMLPLFVLFSGAKNYNDIKQVCVENSEKRKTVDGTVTKNGKRV